MSDKVRKLSVLNITLLSLIIALACVAIIVIVQVYGGDPAARTVTPPPQTTPAADSGDPGQARTPEPPGGTMSDAIKDMYENPPDLFKNSREQVEAYLPADVEDLFRWQCRVGELTDKLATVNDDGVYLATQGKMLYAISPAGEPRWTKTYEDSPVRRPVLDADGNVFCCVKGTVYSYDSAGNLRWEYQTPGSVAAAPVVDSSGNLVVKVRPFREGESYIIAINPEGGERWRYEMEYDLEGYPLVAGTKDRIYDMGRDGVFQTFTRAGTRGWGLGLNRQARGPAVDDRGMLYLAASPQEERQTEWLLMCLEPGMGKEVWSIGLPSFLKASPFVTDDRKVFVISSTPPADRILPTPVLAFNGSGELLWQQGFYGGGWLVCSIRGADPLAYVNGEGAIFLDSSSGEPLFSLNCNAGHPAPVAIWGDTAYCHADGILTAVDLTMQN